MRLSEIITIYLAAGAPFGAHHLSRHSGVETRARLLLRAMGAMLFWPLALGLDRLARRGRPAHESNPREDAFLDQRACVAERAKERLLASLRGIEELAEAAQAEAVRARASKGAEPAKLDQEMRSVRESIEKYVGLTLAAGASDFNGPPAEREMELCRIAGRAGDDLLLAGRCIHRRNAARLLAHRARARAELLHALAALRDPGQGARAASAGRCGRELSAAILKFYGEAVGLLSLLEDRTAAAAASGLLEAERERLRGLEEEGLEAASEDAEKGVGLCASRNLTQAAPASLSQTQPLPQG